MIKKVCWLVVLYTLSIREGRADLSYNYTLKTFGQIAEMCEDERWASFRITKKNVDAFRVCVAAQHLELSDYEKDIVGTKITDSMLRQDSSMFMEKLDAFLEEFLDHFEEKTKSERKIGIKELERVSKDSKLRKTIVRRLKETDQDFPELKKLFSALKDQKADDTLANNKKEKAKPSDSKGNKEKALSAEVSENCPTVLLDSPHDSNSSLAEVPVRSQEGYGTCYLQTAALLMDAWRFSHGDTRQNQLTAPILTYSHLKKRSFLTRLVQWDKGNRSVSYGSDNSFWFEGGSASSVLKLIRKKGIVCTYVSTEKGQNDHDETSELVFTLEEEFDQFEALFDLYRQLKGKTENECYIQPSIASLGQSDLFEDLTHVSFRSFIEKLSGMKCNPVEVDPGQVFNQKVKSKSYRTRKIKIDKILDQWFSTDRGTPIQPMGISYCFDVLEGKKIDWSNRRPNWISECGPHQSAIIGRKFEGGKCRVLVMNSWGKSCASIQTPKSFGGKVECKKGKFWMDQDDLPRMVSELTGLKERN
jgi:hypothetical protein